MTLFLRSDNCFSSKYLDESLHLCHLNSIWPNVSPRRHTRQRGERHISTQYDCWTSLHGQIFIHVRFGLSGVSVGIDKCTHPCKTSPSISRFAIGASLTDAMQLAIATGTWAPPPPCLLCLILGHGPSRNNLQCVKLVSKLSPFAQFTSQMTRFFVKIGT